jgi:hypothetical protein
MAHFKVTVELMSGMLNHAYSATIETSMIGWYWERVDV